MSPHTEYINKLTSYLITHYPDCILIPTRQNFEPNVADKRPAFTHKGKPRNDLWVEWDTVGSKNFDRGLMMILRKGLIVVDVDSMEDIEMIENKFPMFLDTAIQKTSKGKHYFFERTEYCDKNKIYDCARSLKKNGKELAIDIKTKTKNGTGGVISIFPSCNKEWIKPIYDFDHLPRIPNEFIDFIIQHSSQHTDKSKSSIISASGSDPLTAIQMIELQDLMKLLSPSRAFSYQDWMDVGWCLYSVTKGSLQGFELWDAFSKEGGSYKYSMLTCIEKWSEMHVGDKTIASLHFWAKLDNPEKYKEQIRRNVTGLISYCDGTHSSIARVAYTMLKGKHVKDSSWYYFDDNLWKIDYEVTKLRLQLTYNVYEAFIKHSKNFEAIANTSEDSGNKEDYLKTAENLKTYGKSIRNNTIKNHLVRELVDLMYDSEFINHLDTNPNFIAFTNGVWLLKEKQFRPLTSEDMVSKSVGYNFNAERNQEIAEIIYGYWKKMHPNEEQRNYVLQTFARQLYGDACMNKFHVHAGYRADAQNGKSKFFEILSATLGDYAKKFQVQHLTQKKRIEVGKAVPDFEEWKGARILFCEEPNRDDVLNSGVLKDYTGGGEMIYRPLYGEIHRFKPMFKMHLLCNEPPTIEGEDSGIRRRIHKIDYISKFVEPQHVKVDQHFYPIDDYLINNMINNTDYKMEFLHILFDHYDHNFKFDNLPESVKDTTNKYISENDRFAGFFNSCTEESKDSFFTLKQIKSKYRMSEYYDPQKIIKSNDLVKYFGPIREQKKVNNVKHYNVVEGYKLDMDNESDDSETEICDGENQTNKEALYENENVANEISSDDERMHEPFGTPFF